MASRPESLDHITMCTDLVKATKSRTELAAINLLIKYKMRIHSLVHINSEELIPNNPGSTLVHYLHFHDMVNAYALLISYVDISHSVNILHCQTFHNKYPMDMTQMTSDIVKYALCGSKRVVKTIHLDKHLSKILNSNIGEEINKKYASRRIMLMLKLACLFGNEYLMKNAFSLYLCVHPSEEERDKYSVFQIYKPQLNLLSQIGTCVAHSSTTLC